jgi:galactose mutarotase-like enzyme
MIHLQNEFLSATIDPKGAELQTLCRKDNGLDYLWSGDPAYWGKHAPILFPIVGTLRGNTYIFDGMTYTLPRHGFARDKTFDVLPIDEQEAEFTLKDDSQTREVYPFAFLFRVRYRLAGPLLEVEYSVSNPGGVPLYFAIGGHPAFAVPLEKGNRYEDYYLEFNRPETAARNVLKDGLLQRESAPFLSGEQKIPLTHELFANDAVVLHGLQSDTITLKSDRSPHGLCFSIRGWPDLGIWAAPGAPFVCIEPWQGHADYADHDRQLVHKEGMVELAPAGEWKRSWKVELF